MEGHVVDSGGLIHVNDSPPAPADQGTMLVQFLKLVLSFAPWIAFLVLARHSLLQVKIALIVAFALAVGMGVARLSRGVMLWTGLAFFAIATLMVVGLNDLWTLRYMGVLANGTLAAAVWLTLAVGRPFTLDYAREHTDPSLWNELGFLRVNTVISAVWGIALSLGAALAFAKLPGGMLAALLPAAAYDVLSYAILIGAALFTTWYPKYAREKARARSAA